MIFENNLKKKISHSDQWIAYAIFFDKCEKDILGFEHCSKLGSFDIY